jgi:choline transporter-like protein 2/4/5
LVVLAYLAYIALENAKTVKDSKPSEANTSSVVAQEVMAYVLIGLTAIYLCLLCYLHRRINLAIALLREASRALAKMKTMILVPIVFFLVLLVFLSYWVVAAAYIMANAKPDPEYSTYTRGLIASNRIRPTQVDFKWDNTLRYLMGYHFFGLLWTGGFILAFLFMSLAVSVSTWYFLEPPRNAPMNSPVWKGVKTTFRYHMGTISFGSFIIGVVQFVRALLLYISHKLKAMNPQGSLGGLVRCMLCYCSCCMAYVKRFLEFLSKNAYVETAIEGTSFCRAAKDVFKLILNNVLRVGTVNFIADFVTFCGKVMITGANCIIAFYLTRVDSMIQGGDANQLSSSLLPVIVVAIISWFIAQLFMHVYETSMTVLMICFLHDEQEYGGHFASNDLKDFVSKKAPKQDVSK